MFAQANVQRGAAAFIVLVGCATSLSGQALDRNATPTPGRTPVFHVPTPTRVKLTNGAELVVVEKHDLPLIAFSISWIGGSKNFDPLDKVGLSSITGQMMREGTTTRTADQLSDAQQLLGTFISGSIRDESGSLTFFALKDKFGASLDLLADVLEHPTFPGDALERIRGQTLVRLTQAKASPNFTAGLVFARVLFGDTHPYGQYSPTEATINAITRADLVALHQKYFRPGGAIITVAGDIDAAAARVEVERALAGWAPGGSPPAFDYPALPARKPTTIYLVDKKEAAQSVVHIGLPGPPRSTPDYYAMEVMNNILGVLFQSRLNHNIREEKGYSYGVGSAFTYGRGPGEFDATGGIVTAKTDSALIEFMKELKGVQGGKPFTQDEITQGKLSLIQSLPDRFSSVRAMSGSFSSLYTDGVSDTFYRDFAANINAVTAADLVRVARKYIDLDHLDIVIVGDRATIERPLTKTGIAPVVILDAEGNRVGVP